MEKWCDYGISNASKENGEITEVYVHKDMGDYFQAIGVMTENQVIALIDKGFSFITILWGYPKWWQGAEVSVINGQNRRYLRTDKDETEKDNLLNLPLILI